MKILNKQEHQQIAINHSFDVDFKDFIRLYRKCTTELYSFLIIDTILPLNNVLYFQKNLFKEV